MATLVLRRANLWCVQCQSHPSHLASFCTWTETWENLNLIICCHGEEAVIEMPLRKAHEILEQNGRIDIFTEREDLLQNVATSLQMLPDGNVLEMGAADQAMLELPLENPRHQLLLGDHNRPLLLKEAADSSQS